MLHLILSMTLIADPGDDNFAVRNQENEIRAAVPDVEVSACTDTARARHLCHTAFQLWDLTQKLDRELSVCKVQKNTLDSKLQTMTATTVVHTKVIEVERQLTPLEQAFEYIGAATLVLGGFALGWVVFH